jgi:hypothetical protein
MSKQNPASPSLSSPPSKDETTNENEDGLCEEAFAHMEEQEPLFQQQLPTTEASARNIFETCHGKSHHIGPMVLAKGIEQDVFSKWMGHSELGLYKSQRLVNGTVYIPQAIGALQVDHGILRGLLHKERHVAILNEDNAVASYLETGSGSSGGLNPDVFWWRSGGEAAQQARVLLEVGIDQSLPDLRRRAETLFFAQAQRHGKI